MLGFIKDRDGVESAVSSSHLEHITARLVEGMMFENVSSFHATALLIVAPQMHPKDGSPLSLDSQLCISSHIPPFLSLSVLRSRLDVFSGIFSLY